MRLLVNNASDSRAVRFRQRRRHPERTETPAGSHPSPPPKGCNSRLSLVSLKSPFPWQFRLARLNERNRRRRGRAQRGFSGRHGKTMNANYRNFALWVIIFLLVLALVTLFQSPGQKAPSSEITFSQLLTDADAGNIRDVTIAGPEITGHMKDGRAFQTYAPNDPVARPDPVQEGRDDHGEAAVRRQQLGADDHFQRPAGPAVPRPVDLHDPPDAGRRGQGDGLRQVEGQAFDRGVGPRHLRGRRRRRRGQGRPAGDRRVPARPAEVPEARRADSARRAAGRPARHRQDADRPRGRGRSERAVLHHFRLRLRRDVRRRRREPRARHVRAGQEERALHHLHRRNRRGRPPSRRGPRRRQRRARADPEPAARRDGRLRAERRHHHHRRDQPARRARSGAAASRPLRPADRDLQPRLHRPREDPQGSRAQGPARARRRPQGRRARHARASPARIS